MEFGYGHTTALVVSEGVASIVRMRKDRGVGYTLWLPRDVQNFHDHQKELDLYQHGSEDGRFLQVVHVVATAARAADLPSPETVVIPDSRAIEQAVPGIQLEIDAARLSKQMKDYLGLLLQSHNRVTAAVPFMAEAGNDSAMAIKLAVRKMAAWETTLFFGMESVVKETIRVNVRGDDAGGARAAGFAARVQEAVRPDRPEPAPVVATAPTQDDDSVEKCKADLLALLAETTRKLGDIDRRLIDLGPVPAWRDTLNEVWEAAMQGSRAIDYMPDEPRNDTPRRRR
ncbi:hypothetical protein [Rhizobium sp. BK176]|uniref:hypothetical protein n=1 Tax=Rhizobium sp. BK176 TaxID=2587071 RepID=UPI002166E3DD|nr:hypothetical protein [Rhizobium sp. BK176]MCS4088554.1 hypothetical protein [Rhizobium sp. BK176]